MEELLLQTFSYSGILGPVLFIVARALAIIISPIPGFIIDIPGIALFGWVGGLVLAQVGIMAGAMTAFYIGRYFREPLVKRFIPLQKLHRWEEQFSHRQTFWGLVALRLPTNIVFDYLSYAAGLTRMRASVFFFSTFIGNFPTTFIFYYFGGLAFTKSPLYWLVIVIGVIALIFIYRWFSKKYL